MKKLFKLLIIAVIVFISNTYYMGSVQAATVYMVDYNKTDITFTVATPFKIGDILSIRILSNFVPTNDKRYRFDLYDESNTLIPGGVTTSYYDEFSITTYIDCNYPKSNIQNYYYVGQLDKLVKYIRLQYSPGGVTKSQIWVDIVDPNVAPQITLSTANNVIIDNPTTAYTFLTSVFDSNLGDTLQATLYIDGVLKQTQMALSTGAWQPISFTRDISSYTYGHTWYVTVTDSKNPVVTSETRNFTRKPIPVFTISSPTANQIFIGTSRPTFTATVSNMISGDIRTTELCYWNGSIWLSLKSNTNMTNGTTASFTLDESFYQTLSFYSTLTFAFRIDRYYSGNILISRQPLIQLQVNDPTNNQRTVSGSSVHFNIDASTQK